MAKNNCTAAISYLHNMLCSKRMQKVDQVSRWLAYSGVQHLHLTDSTPTMENSIQRHAMSSGLHLCGERTLLQQEPKQTSKFFKNKLKTKEEFRCLWWTHPQWLDLSPIWTFMGGIVDWGRRAIYDITRSSFEDCQITLGGCGSTTSGLTQTGVHASASVRFEGT